MRSLALHAPPGAASAAGGSATADEALSLLRRLLDAREGALQVLRGSPAHLHGWFVGQPAAGNTSSETSTAHNNSSSHPQLGFAHITALLSSLLLRDAVPPSCTKSKALLHGAAAAFAHALGLDVSGQEHTAAASASAHGAQSAPEFLVRPDAPLMAAYRPLLFYTLMETVTWVAHAKLTSSMGFVRARASGAASYYVRKGTSTTKPPIVFLHGIGLGLAPYLPFLRRLAASTDATIVAVQMRHVSMRATSHIPTVTGMADEAEAALQVLGVEGASVIAHSYGTLVASVLAKRRSPVVGRLTLADPVCFAMFLPTLLRNSIFFHHNTAPKPSASAASATTSTHPQQQPHQPRRRWHLRPRVPKLRLGGLLKGVVVRDLHCAAALSPATLHWAELNLWPSDLPQGTTALLSAADHLVPVPEVAAMLQSEAARARGAVTHVYPGKGHGSFVLDPAMQAVLIEAATGSPAAAAEAGAGAEVQPAVPAAVAAGLEEAVAAATEAPVTTAAGAAEAVVAAVAQLQAGVADEARVAVRVPALEQLIAQQQQQRQQRQEALVRAAARIPGSPVGQRVGQIPSPGTVPRPTRQVQAPAVARTATWVNRARRVLPWRSAKLV